MNDHTSDGALRGAWEALLRGDTTERDRYVERAEALLAAEREADAVAHVLAVDFYVNARGVVIPTKLMAREAGVLQ